MRKHSVEEKEKQLKRFLMGVAEAADAALREYCQDREAEHRRYAMEYVTRRGLSRNSDSIDRQHHTIPNQRNQRPKDKHYGNVHNRLWNPSHIYIFHDNFYNDKEKRNEQVNNRYFIKHAQWKIYAKMVILFFDKFLLNISKKCNRQRFFPSIWVRGYQYEKKGGSNGGLRDNLSVLET